MTKLIAVNEDVFIKPDFLGNDAFDHALMLDFYYGLERALMESAIRDEYTEFCQTHTDCHSPLTELIHLFDDLLKPLNDCFVHFSVPHKRVFQLRSAHGYSLVHPNDHKRQDNFGDNYMAIQVCLRYVLAMMIAKKCGPGLTHLKELLSILPYAIPLGRSVSYPSQWIVLF